MSKPTQLVNFILKLLNLLKEIVVYPIIIVQESPKECISFDDPCWAII